MTVKNPQKERPGAWISEFLLFPPVGAIFGRESGLLLENAFRTPNQGLLRQNPVAKNSQLVFASMVSSATKEVIDEMHSVELERKLRLPDPTKAMEGVWKLLRRTRQQLNTTASKSIGVSTSVDSLAAKRAAKLEAERQKARAAQYAMWTTLR